MNTLSEYFKRDSAYWGEKQDWLVVLTTNRDADTLTRSNFRCMVQLLGGKESDGAKGSTELSEHAAIEEARHWACGWVQYLVINPDNKELVAIAEEQLASLENYPVVNEDDWSNLEMEEANQVWQSCYNQKERVEYIRNHRRQFEFHDFSDLLNCVRGKYFAGWASELLN